MMSWLNSNVCTCGTKIDGSMTKPGWVKGAYYGIQTDSKTRDKFLLSTCKCGKEYICKMQQKSNIFNIADIMPLEIEVEADKEKKIEAMPFEDVKTEIEELKEETIPFVEAEEEKPKVDIDKMERPELMALAKELNIDGKIATFKTETLREKVKEATK